MAASIKMEPPQTTGNNDENAASEDKASSVKTSDMMTGQDMQSETRKSDPQEKSSVEFKAPSFHVPSLKLARKAKQPSRPPVNSATAKNPDDIELESNLTKGKADGDHNERIQNQNTEGQSSEEKLATASTSNKRSLKSPAELLVPPPPLPYKEPQWSGLPESNYSLDVLKNGCIISNISLNDKPFHVFGRLDVCDVPLEHPSVSRYHAILQYRAFDDDEHSKGFYLYDLNSTHGTIMNKSQLSSKTYYRMRVGHMFKLGGSSRNYILQGPEEDQEEESQYSVTELKEMRQKQMEKLEALEKDEADDYADERIKHKQEIMKEEEDVGIDWGMGDDAIEEDTSENPFAVIEPKEPLDLKDPKKTLRGFFEREGEELEYETDEKGFGHNRQFVCRVRLPIDDANGQPIYAEAAVSGKKKEAVLACALEACQILDNHGLLRQATHESKKRKTKNWEEEDYYDSDDDTFLDRTGMIEKKRLQRMKRAGKEESVVETYDSLLTKFAAVEKEVDDIEKQLAEKEALADAEMAGSEDALDAFMKSIKEGKGTDKVSRSKLKLKLFDLRKEKARLEKLMKIAKPTVLPPLVRPAASPTKKSEATRSVMVGKMPMIGSMKRGKISFKKFKTEVSSTTTMTTKQEAPDEEEEEEDEEMEKADERSAFPVAMETSRAQVEKDSMVSRESHSTAIPEDVSEPEEISEHEKSSLTDQEIKPDVPQMKTTTSHDTYMEETEGEIYAADQPSQNSTKSAEKKQDKKPSHTVLSYDLDADDEHCATWLPPEGQTGDGRTHLNDKYGY
ncbi:kanadaptin-like [Ptychodera flava]|uniref:kanadaptin-like n=1 Tax=Ptychodera flava TaxID=63121 RepID=UPI00396AA3BB